MNKNKNDCLIKKTKNNFSCLSDTFKFKKLLFHFLDTKFSDCEKREIWSEKDGLWHKFVLFIDDYLKQKILK